jgi:hypothetical protein
MLISIRRNCSEIIPPKEILDILMTIMYDSMHENHDPYR